jgi:hypothetical protein
MIETIGVVLSGAALVVGLGDIVVNRVDAWKQLQKEQRERITALKAETVRNLGIIRELEKEDLKGAALQKPAIRKLISRLSSAEAGKISREVDRILGKQLIKQGKAGAQKNSPAGVFFAIRTGAAKIADLKERAALASKPAPHATRTILSRRIPAIRKKLDIIDSALAGIPPAPGAAGRKTGSRR